MSKIIMTDRVFRVNYTNKVLGPHNQRKLVFTEALAFAKTKCDKERTATIDEILIYSDDSEKISTQWLVTAETHSIIPGV